MVIPCTSTSPAIDFYVIGIHFGKKCLLSSQHIFGKELRSLSLFKLLNHSADMRPSKFICFYFCFAFVFKTASSTRTNVTGSDGKVFISGDRNEVVVSTAREAKINLVDKGTSKGESMNKGNIHALNKRMRSMEKIERNLRVMNQSVQSLFTTMEKEDQSILKKLNGFDDNRNSSNAEIRRQQDGMNQTISYLFETVTALKESNRKMNKSNAELFAQLMSISQRLSSFERRGTFVFVLSYSVLRVSQKRSSFISIYFFFSKVNQIEPRSKVRFSFKVLKYFYFLHFTTRSCSFYYSLANIINSSTIAIDQCIN